MAMMKICIRKPFILLALTICILCENIVVSRDFSKLRFQQAAAITPLQKVINDLTHLTRVTNAISLQTLAIGKIVKMREVGAELLGTNRGEFSTLLDTDVAAIKSFVEKIPDPSNLFQLTTNISAEQQAALRLVANVIDVDIQYMKTAKSLKVGDIFTKIDEKKQSSSWDFCIEDTDVVNALEVLKDTSKESVAKKEKYLRDLHSIADRVPNCFKNAPKFVADRENDTEIFRLIDHLAVVTRFLEGYKQHLSELTTLPTLFRNMENDFKNISNLNQLSNTRHVSDLEMANNARTSLASEQVPLYTAGFPRGYLDLEEVLNDTKSEWFLRNVADGNKENVGIVEQGLERFKVFSEEMMKLSGSWRNFTSYNGSAVKVFTDKWKKAEGNWMDPKIGNFSKEHAASVRDCLSRGPTTLANLVTTDIQAVTTTLLSFKIKVQNFINHIKTANSTVDVTRLADFFTRLKGYTLGTNLQENIVNIKNLWNFKSLEAIGPFFKTEQSLVSDIKQTVAPSTFPDLAKILNETKIDDMHVCFANKSLGITSVLSWIESLRNSNVFAMDAAEKAEVNHYLDTLAETQRDGLAFESAVASAFKERRTRRSGTIRDDFKIDLAISQRLGSGLQTLHHMEVAHAKKSILQKVAGFNETISSAIISISTPPLGTRPLEDAKVAAAFEDPEKVFLKLRNELDDLHFFARDSYDDNLTCLKDVFETASKIRGLALGKEALRDIVDYLRTQRFDTEAATITELSTLNLDFANGNLDSMATTLTAAKGFFDGLFSAVPMNPEAAHSLGTSSSREWVPPFPIWKFLIMLLGHTVLIAVLVLIIWKFEVYEDWKKEGIQMKEDDEEYDAMEKIFETQNLVELEARWQYSMFLDRRCGRNLCFEYTRMTHEQYVDFIEDGAFVNCYNVYGNTPLHVATKAGISDWVELLIRNGADRTMLNGENKTAEEMIPKNYMETKYPIKYIRTKRIYKSLKDQTFPCLVPHKFDGEQFRIYIDPRVEHFQVKQFKERFKWLVSDKIDEETTHVVCSVDDVKRILELLPREIDYPILLSIFKGLIMIKDEWINACNISTVNFQYSSKFVVDRLIYNGVYFKNAVQPWTAAQGKGTMPYLYGAHVIITAQNLTNSYLHELIEHLGGVVLPETPDHYLYNEAARPYLLSHMGALFIIHTGEIDEKRLKPHPLLSLFTPDEFVVFLLKREVRRNESKPVIPLMGPIEP